MRDSRVIWREYTTWRGVRKWAYLVLFNHSRLRFASWLRAFAYPLPPLRRFINHCCAPNAELQRWSVDGYTRIGVFATQALEAGAEITYDYKFFTAEEIRCGCGAATCRGWLGANIAADKEKEAAEAAARDPKRRRP